uniref:Uncharacterized protein n=1 Tax=Branchiostoma floridae TaxID=7739 RepID=C3ZIB8_BRAFL|eukprot:XP_002591632.1 hypothetical protein BRAFLDRAFT_80731 [Branchiostoma floridae]
MAGLANKLQDLELCLKSPHSQTIQYGRALRDAIIQKDDFMEVEVLKSLGDLFLQKGKRSKDSAEFDKAAALYAAALLRCTDSDMGQTLEHRIGYLEKLSRQLLQGYSPRIQWWSSSNKITADNNILRVAQICHRHRVDGRIGKPWHSVEEIYMETLVTAITDRDAMLELEVLKSLGDLYLENGKSRSDLVQLSKASAMYNKSLAKCICEEHGLKQTLHRRILYTEKIREVVIRNLSKRPDGGLTEEDRQRYRWYKHHFGEGESFLARADLDSAEQHFAAALQAVHIGDPTAQQYQREVEPLCKLGDVYSKRGQRTGDGGDFVKAAALYNAARARSKAEVTNGNIEKAIKGVETSFLKYILGICHRLNRDDTAKQKKQLKEMRDQIKLEMDTIDQQLDPYVHDEDDPCVNEIQAKRAQAVRHLFEKIAQERKEFISLLVEECIGLMGPSPCKYALIGLGSQATGLVTPYSDLEFAILVEEESEPSFLYFRKLTHYLHLKVVNLGETILPTLGIKSLNNFYSKNPLHNWYYDSVTPRGFAFDGSMPKACKTPLGRQGTMNQSPSELICTPENMVSKIKNDVALYLKKGYHLANILRNPCLIAGDQYLIQTYKGITVNTLQADWGEVSRLLVQQALFGHFESYSDGRTNLANLIDVKKEIYRFPVVAVDCMALSSGIIPTTVWKTIEEMENKQVISSDNAHHLTVLTSISAELRLRTYIANGGQRESLSALASTETTCHGQETCQQSIDKVPGNSMKPVFHLPNEKQLLRYYCTVIPLQRILSEWPVQDQVMIMHIFPDFYDDSPMVRGKMYFDLCRYDLAIRYIEEALKQTGDSKAEKVSLLNNLAAVWHCRGEYKKAIDYSEQALQSRESIFGHGTADPDIATSLKYLGSAWIGLEDVRKAIKHFEQELQMNKSIYGQSTPNPDIATSLNNLGGAWHKLGDYEKAIRYCRESLQMKRSIYGQSTAHPDTANSLNSMGLALGSLGDHRKAISYSEQALQMLTCIYGHNTAHPDIAVLLHNLGAAWHKLGDHGKATSYYEQALQMFKSVYSQTRAHPDIAGVLNSLGEVWYSQGDHEKAISYFDKAIQMLRDIYGQDAVHPHIAHLYENLGRACNELCDNERAIDYLENALQMLRVIHGKNTTHADIAGALVSLGEAWSGFKGDNRKAIRYCEEALQMHRSIHGPNVASEAIAKSLFYLGYAWFFLGDFRKVKSYLEEALQVYTMIHGQTEIVHTLRFQGLVCFLLKDYDAAFIKHNQAFALARKIDLQNKEPWSMHLMEVDLSITRPSHNESTKNV